MTTLTEYYEDVDAKRATVEVVIAGSTLTGVLSASWVFAIQRVPTATIRIPNPPPAFVAFFADVYINAGFNGVVTRVFTGKVMHVNPDEGGCAIECVGKSWPLDVHYHKVIYTFSSVTAETAITDLLDQSGIADYEVNVPAWTIGTVCEQTLEFQTYSEAIIKVGEVDGVRWYEMPTGLVRVEVADPIPALATWRDYFSMQLTGLVESYPAGIASGRPRLRTVITSQEIREAKNQSFVRGCTYTQTNADGTEDSIDVEANAHAPSPWVLLPSGAQAYNDILFGNELIDTPAKAGVVAVRLVTVMNRLYTLIAPTIDGDPQIFLAGTVGIEDPAYSRTTGRWFVESYTTMIEEDDFYTVISLLGGEEAGGQIQVDPFALFTRTAEREVMGDREWIIVTLDGRPSSDPDGTIVGWLWTDNQAPPIATGTDSVITIRADPATLVTPWIVTLTVTDNDGNTDDISLTIPVDPGSEDMFFPALFTAFDQWFSASPDGGVNWNDEADPGGDAPVVISVGAKVSDGETFGVAWYGTSAGAIYKTTDYCATAPVLVMAAIGSPIEHIWPDLNHPGNAWAISQDGKLYRSVDDGDNWPLYDDLRLVLDLPDIRLSRVATPAPDGVWVFGGEGIAPGPLIAFDPVLSHNWFKAAVGGELSTDLGSSGGGTPLGPAAIQGGTSVGPVAKLVAYGAADWSIINTTTIFCHGSGDHIHLKNLAGVLWRILDLGTGAGCLQRSLDEGANWTTVMHWNHQCSENYSGVVAIDRATDGTLWVAYQNYDGAVDRPTLIYKSVDGGDVWTLAATLDDASQFTRTLDICCHPSDPLTIAVAVCTYSPGPYFTCYYTTDGWATKNHNHTTTGWSIGGGWPGMSSMIFGHGGNRLIYMRGYATQIGIEVSDDFFATWDTKMLVATAGVRQYGLLRARSNEIFACYADYAPSPDVGYIAQSSDDGWIWDEDWATTTGLGANDVLYGIAWDLYAEALYTYSRAMSVPPAKLAFKWTPAGGWVDITYDLDAEVGASPDIFDICAPVKIGGGGATDVYIKEAASREAGELAIILNSETHTPAVYYTFDILGDGSDWTRCLACPAKPRGRWLAPDLEIGKFVFAFDDTVIYRGDVAGGVMTATVAPAALNAGEEPNHGIWIGQVIGGIAGCYIVAAIDVVPAIADGMLYKTFDRFETIDLLRPAAGFPACEAGSRGYMIALSGQGSGGGGPPAILGRVLFAGTVGTDRFAAWRLDDIAWTKKVFATELDGCGTLLPRAFTSQLWFILGFYNETAYNHANNKIVRTKDGGTTWASFTQPKAGNDYWQDFALDAGGRLWGLTLDTTTNVRGIVKSWYSDDDGDSWTLSATITGTAVPSQYHRVYRIICHPSNQNIIAILGNTGHSSYYPLTWYTEDRGGSWTLNIEEVAFSVHTYAFCRDAIMTAEASWRIIMGGMWLVAGPNNHGIASTDDKGLSWTVRKLFGSVNDHWSWGVVGNHLGNKLFALHLDDIDPANKITELWRSLDSGTTWEQFDNDVVQRSAGSFGKGGLAYDELADAVYVVNQGGHVANLWHVDKLSPVVIAGEWLNFTDELLPIDGFATHAIDDYARFVCAIPR